MKEHKNEFSIKTMARVLEVSRSGYYVWINRPKCKRIHHNEYLLEMINKSYHKSHRNYGSPRIYKDLKRQGIECGRHRVANLMRINGLVSKRKRRPYKEYTQSTNERTFKNLLNRNFNVTQPNSIWASDITTLWTGSGWLHISIVMDLFSRRIIGWSMHSRITDELTVNALEMALLSRKPLEGLMHHSDQGSQYKSYRLKELMDKNGITASMSRKGNCYDNAVVESFFKTLKYEWTRHIQYKTREEAEKSIFEFIEIYYNQQRLHSTLGYLSPVEYEKKLIT